MSNPFSIIAFAGPAGVGKDTAGARLIDKFGFKKLSFAQPLKDMLAAIGCPSPATAEEKEAIIPWLGVSWRKLGQTLGTEWGRNTIDPDLWVKIAERYIRQEGGAFVITDLRFENEATLVRSMNGIVVHLSGRAAQMAPDTAEHVSEQGVGVQTNDVSIDNSSTLDALYEHLDTLPQYVGVPALQASTNEAGSAG